METIPQGVHPSWIPHLTPLFDNEHVKRIKYEVLTKAPFYPQGKDIFNVFSIPIQDIKVVVVGSDPYPNPAQATGYAFAVPFDITVPPSLRVIGEEIINEVQEGLITERKLSSPVEWKTLQHWRDQGVFLLNKALTVEQGKAESHMNDWHWFTSNVINIISEIPEIKPVWLMWGAKAKGSLAYVNNAWDGSKGRPDKPVKDMNVYFTAHHPAASAYNPNNSFIGCNHFYLANKVLQAKGLTPIEW